MATVPIFVKAEGARQLDHLSRRLKEAGRGELQKQLRREIREEGRPVIAHLQRAVMAVDVSSTRGGVAPPDRSTELRARVAKHTGLSVTKRGIRIRVRSRRVEPEYPKIVKYLDASLNAYSRWRHPVFGRTKHGTWTGPWTQQSGEPWFFVTIAKHRRDFRRAVFEAIRKTNEKITS